LPAAPSTTPAVHRNAVDARSQIRKKPPDSIVFYVPAAARRAAAPLTLFMVAITTM
jgi:hypothetical protein